MQLATTTIPARFRVLILWGNRGVNRFGAGKRDGDMRGTYLPGPRATASYGHSDALKRRSAILLSGTAAIALSIVQPASAIVINDQVATQFGGVANYYDKNNEFPNVVSLFDNSSG